ncbi:ABC-type multidrug transport system ATPase subunit [Leucobacter luti]|nr:ABC-type multidrug transport system ATPase subunit [Leucobacter luti]
MCSGDRIRAKLRVRSLSKCFGEFSILDEVSFNLFPGEVVGLVGPNGAGKSTLMRVLAGVFTPSSGEAAIDEYAVGTAPARRAMSLMPEEPDLYPGLSVLEHISMMDRINLVPRAERRSPQLDLERYDLLHKSDALPHELSQGMKRKLALVLALRKGANLLLFDEPFNGLDPLASRELRCEIRGLGSQGATILISMHGLRELEEIADRVLFLYAGKLVHSAVIRGHTAEPTGSLEDLYLRVIGVRSEHPGP